MIKLNHKNSLVEEHAKRLVNKAYTTGITVSVIKSEYSEPFYFQIIKVEGYRIAFTKHEDFPEVRIDEVWQLDDCEDPIFIA